MNPDSGERTSTRVQHANAVSREALYDDLLLRFDIRDIDAAISWLKVRGFIGAFGFGVISPEMGYELTDKGVVYGRTGEMTTEDRRRLSGKVVRIEPEIYGLSLNVKEAWWQLRRLFTRK